MPGEEADASSSLKGARSFFQACFPGEELVAFARVADIDSSVGIACSMSASAEDGPDSPPLAGFFTFAVQLASRAQPVTVVCKVKPWEDASARACVRGSAPLCLGARLCSLQRRFFDAAVPAELAQRVPERLKVASARWPRLL